MPRTISQPDSLMFSRTEHKQIDLHSARDIARSAEKLATRRIWLPKLLYDGLPWFYLAAGLAALLATLYISDWFWIVPHYFLFSAACLHLACTVYRRRHQASKESLDDTR